MAQEHPKETEIPNNINDKKQKKETSKLIVLLTGIQFAIVIFSCLTIFIYCTIRDKNFDWTGIVALVGVSGSVFGTAVASYESKAKFENIQKIKTSFLKEKYKILNEIGAFDCMRAQQEIESEINSIDYDLEVAEDEASLNPEYNQIY